MRFPRLAVALLALGVATAAAGQTPTLVGTYFSPNPQYQSNEVVIAPEIDRALSKITDTALAGWRLSTFPQDVQRNVSKLLPPAVIVDAAHDPGWSFVQVDGAILNNFTYDDRGYLYLSYGGPNGFGITDANGVLLAQVTGYPGFVATFKYAGRYYVLVDTPATATLYDATDPHHPTFVRSEPFEFLDVAAGTNAMAIVTSTGIEFWRRDALVNGGTAFRVVDGFGYGVATDGTRFVAAHNEAEPQFGTAVTLFTPSGGDFDVTMQHFPGYYFGGIRYGGGLFALTLTKSGAVKNDGVIFTTENGALVPHDISGFLQNKFGTQYVAPMSTFVIGGNPYLIVPGSRVGRLYLLPASVFGGPAAALPAEVPMLFPFALLALIAAIASLALLRMR